jgi:hypothetical protein
MKMMMTKKNQKMIVKLVRKEIEDLKWAVENGLVPSFNKLSLEKMAAVALNNAITSVDSLIKLRQDYYYYTDVKALSRLKKDLLTEYAMAVRETQFTNENERLIQIG